MRPRSKEADAKAIAHHYDVSNEFYALFLDPLMVYTCAYYRDPDGKLEQAQQRQARPGVPQARARGAARRLLDIGCGWGSLSIWAAQHYGVRAHGVTLSKAQADYATERIRKEGLEDRCQVEYRDYRDLPAGRALRQDRRGRGDRARRHPELSGVLRRRARGCCGTAASISNHGIVHEFHWKATQPDRVPLSPRLPERRSRGAQRDADRDRSAPASRSWTSRGCGCTTRGPAATGSSACASAADEARALAGERTYRTWLLYLTCSAVAFAESSIGLYQVLTRKQQRSRRESRAAHARAPVRQRHSCDAETGKGRCVDSSDPDHRDRVVRPGADRHLRDVDLSAPRARAPVAVAAAGRRPSCSARRCWLLTGQSRQQWVAVHRKHHTFADRDGDPHSPLLLGFWKVQLWNVYYYIREARQPKTVETFAPDLAPDWWERRVFSLGLDRPLPRHRARHARHRLVAGHPGHVRPRHHLHVRAGAADQRPGPLVRAARTSRTRPTTRACSRG